METINNFYTDSGHLSKTGKQHTILLKKELEKLLLSVNNEMELKAFEAALVHLIRKTFFEKKLSLIK